MFRRFRPQTEIVIRTSLNQSSSVVSPENQSTLCCGDSPLRTWISLLSLEERSRGIQPLEAGNLVQTKRCLGFIVSKSSDMVV